MIAPINHNAMLAYALCWPNDPEPLLFASEKIAEENRKWFKEHYKTDKNGAPRGEPFVLVLCVQQQAQQPLS